MSFPDNELLNGACYVQALSVRKKKSCAFFFFFSRNQMAGKCYYEDM